MVKYLILIIIIFISCKENEPQQPYKPETDNFLIKSKNNERINILTEDSIIKNIIKSKNDSNWKKSKLGYWMKMLKINNNPKAISTNLVSYNMKVLDLDNNIIYDYEDIGTKHLVLEKNNEIRAIEDVLKKMGKDEEACLIIPYYLAYGVAGDENKIKQYQSIQVYLKVNSIKKFNKNK